MVGFWTINKLFYFFFFLTAVPVRNAHNWLLICVCGHKKNWKWKRKFVHWKNYWNSLTEGVKLTASWRFGTCWTHYTVSKFFLSILNDRCIRACIRRISISEKICWYVRKKISLQATAFMCSKRSIAVLAMIMKWFHNIAYLWCQASVQFHCGSCSRECLRARLGRPKNVPLWERERTALKLYQASLSTPALSHSYLILCHISSPTSFLFILSSGAQSTGSRIVSGLIVQRKRCKETLKEYYESKLSRFNKTLFFGIKCEMNSLRNVERTVPGYFDIAGQWWNTAVDWWECYMVEMCLFNMFYLHLTDVLCAAISFSIWSV